MRSSQSPYQRGTFRLMKTASSIYDKYVSIPLSAGHVSTDLVTRDESVEFVSIPLSAGHVSTVPFGNCSKQGEYTGVLQKNQAGTGKKLKKRKLLPENISGCLYKMLKNKKIEIMQKNCSQVSAV